MKEHFLDFERPLAEIIEKIEALQAASNEDPELLGQIEKLRKEEEKLKNKIFSKLSTWQKVQVARHPQRPHTSDYIKAVFSDFIELHGDRQFADDQSIIGGIAEIEGNSVMVIGHEKGRETEDKVKRNFGMPQPEGYRKAKRLMQLAERLTPIIVIITGEGGSGGALAIGVGDHIAILEHATYSVASPEACASIIWRTAEKASDAAEAMKVSAQELIKIKIVDEIIKEPLGGAHRDYKEISESVRSCILKNLGTLLSKPIDDLLEARYKKLLEIG